MRFDPSRPNNFDLLRLAAATLVLVDQSNALTGRLGGPGPFGYETPAGFAVAVFFIISGFLVAASWERAPRLWAFMLKRALRIVPAYAVVVAFAALVLGPLGTNLSLRAYFVTPATWAYFLDLTIVELHYSLPGVFGGNPYPLAVNGSIWTLPIEVAMYIALAGLGFIGAFSRAVVTALVASLAVGWLAWGADATAAPPLYFEKSAHRLTLHLALWFFTGSALWLWREQIDYRADVAVALRERPCASARSTTGGRAWPYPVYLAAAFLLCLACAVASRHGIEHPALRLKPRRSAPAAHEADAADLIEGKTAGSGGP